jgi:ribosome-associated translation inhibitor RaiA
MQTIINPADDMSLSEPFTRHVHESLEKVDTRFGDWLTRIEVFLRDVNGPKGGVDKHCRMEARPRGQDPIVVDHQDEDAYTCAARAAGKLEKALDRRRGQLEARERK